MSVKKNLLAEIDKKAQKIRSKRVDAANNKSLEAAVFDFFKNVEAARKMHQDKHYDEYLFDQARRSLFERLKGFDSRVKISVEFNKPEDPLDNRDWNEHVIRGVTVWWSTYYQTTKGVSPSLYIDVSQMLFI